MTEVEVYDSRADKIRLLLNGSVIGQARGRVMAVVRRREPGTATLAVRGETLGTRTCEIGFR